MLLALFAAVLATLAALGVILALAMLSDHRNALRDLNARQDAHALRLGTLEQNRRAEVRR